MCPLGGASDRTEIVESIQCVYCGLVNLVIFADIAYSCFHFLDIFRAPVPIHKSGEMRQEYEKQKTKVSYGVKSVHSSLQFSHVNLFKNLQTKKHSF